MTTIMLKLLATDDVKEVSRAFNDGHSFVAGIAINTLFREADGFASFRVSDKEIISSLKENGRNIEGVFYRIDTLGLIAVQDKFNQYYADWERFRDENLEQVSYLTYCISTMTKEQRETKMYHDFVEDVSKLLHFANEYHKSVVFAVEG